MPRYDRCGDCIWFEPPSPKLDEPCKAMISLPPFAPGEKSTPGLPTMLGSSGSCETAWGTANQREFLKQLKALCNKHSASFNLFGGKHERERGTCRCQQSFDTHQHHPRAIDYCDGRGEHCFQGQKYEIEKEQEQ